MFKARLDRNQTDNVWYKAVNFNMNFVIAQIVNSSTQLNINKYKNAARIGIDLGTTFSLAAIYKRGKSEIISNKDGEKSTPSFIFYSPSDTTVSVGSTAEDRGLSHAENFLFDMKRIIGRKYDDVYVQKIKTSNQHFFKIVEGSQGETLIELQHNKTVIRKKPEEICSEILRYLKSCASEYLGGLVKEAVISVPAYFSNAQKKATISAAQAAGLKVLTLITEPVAAAINYTENHKVKLGTFLVFDFGGGTLDISIIKVNGQSLEVKAVEGDCFLGGRDIDDILFNHFLRIVADQFPREPNYMDRRLCNRIRTHCIQLKKKLSSELSYEITLFSAGPLQRDILFEMTRREFEQKAQTIFDRALRLVDKCLHDANISKGSITDVILVGGSSRIPKIRTMLKTHFGAGKIRTNISADEAVALGASHFATFFNTESSHYSTYKVTEATPLSLGLAFNKGFMEIIIRKNSTIPAKNSLTCVTSENNQTECSFEIFEGERKNCKYNNLLGSFEITDLPPGRAGEVEFEVTFMLNNNGILEVESRVVSTGVSQKLAVTLGDYGLCDRQVRQRIKSAEQNRREDDLFENFVTYLWDKETKCNHIMFDLKLIEDERERAFVKTECEHFLAYIESITYENMDLLKNRYQTFTNNIEGIVSNAMNINLGNLIRPVPRHQPTPPAAPQRRPQRKM
ncbi:heat shock 70 kDa protein isoform X2 [Dendroctonus ponderosae]|uniref:Uncharacterized protein n=1 Tax=Dendroctonus ponderosae TaxID=77166 RepID=A0AAR5P133_DENPD|nr:heat shock 70 kDa protein isoform X2 [Dendroctonus ponderosae]